MTDKISLKVLFRILYKYGVTAIIRPLDSYVDLEVVEIRDKEGVILLYELNNELIMTIPDADWKEIFKDEYDQNKTRCFNFTT